MQQGGQVKRYEPCECEGRCERRGFRCAVHHVIWRFGIDPNCECRANDGPLCVACEARGEREKGPFSPLPAFQAAMPPYRELARGLSEIAGVKLELVSSEPGKRFYRLVNDQEEAVVRVLMAADSDPLAYDVALWMAAERIRYNLPFPELLREWAFFAMTGQIERPKLRGKHLATLQWRNEMIVELVREVSCDFGLRPTAAGDDGGESACAAVAEALRLMRLQPHSYSAVRRIWQERDEPPRLPDWAI